MRSRFFEAQNIVVLLAFATLVAWQAHAYRAQLAALEDETRRLERLALAAVPWAPMMEEVRTMSSWQVEGAGDDSYNGVYEEAGEYNARPYYQYGEGDAARYLFWDTDWSAWLLHTGLTGMNPAYTGTGANLPANPWSVSGGTPPAPTVSLYTPPPPQPDPNPGTEAPGPSPGIVAPTHLPCRPVRPGRMDIGGVDHLVFLGYDPYGPGIVLFNVATRQWRGLTGPALAVPALPVEWLPHPTLLAVGDGETIWLVTHPAGYRAMEIAAWPITLNPAGHNYTVGSVFNAAVTTWTDLVVDDAGVAWFVERNEEGTVHKLRSWDLTGTTITEVKDWSTGGTRHGYHPLPRFWYAGAAGKFVWLWGGSGSPQYPPDYPNLISATEYEWLGDKFSKRCIAFAHRGDFGGLTIGIARWAGYGSSLAPEALEHVCYRPGGGDAWDAMRLAPTGADHAWVLRGDPPATVGVRQMVFADGFV